MKELVDDVSFTIEKGREKRRYEEEGEEEEPWREKEGEEEAMDAISAPKLSRLPVQSSSSLS